MKEVLGVMLLDLVHLLITRVPEINSKNLSDKIIRNNYETRMKPSLHMNHQNIIITLLEHNFINLNNMIIKISYIFVFGQIPNKKYAELIDADVFGIIGTISLI